MITYMLFVETKLSFVPVDLQIDPIRVSGLYRRTWRGNISKLNLSGGDKIAPPRVSEYEASQIVRYRVVLFI